MTLHTIISLLWILLLLFRLLVLTMNQQRASGGTVTVRDTELATFNLHQLRGKEYGAPCAFSVLIVGAFE